MSLLRDTFAKRRYRTLASAPSRALKWLRAHEHPQGGIDVHNVHTQSYPEVTGYLIPTMMAYGEKELASRSIKWLIQIQKEDGSFGDPDRNSSYVFDTGQALRGLLAGIKIVPEAREAAKRAYHWLFSQLIDDGRKGFPQAYKGISFLPESVHLYVLPPLQLASKQLDLPSCLDAVTRCIEFYLSCKGTLDLESTLTHFLGYEIEALIDLGRIDAVAPILQKTESLQRKNGAVRGIGGARWVCIPGLLQLAVCWYKSGRNEAANRAMKWSEAHQEESGGFRGSNGFGAWYFQKYELAWATKYYLDANILRVKTFFNDNENSFPDSIKKDDGRLEAVLSAIRSEDSVLEVGCGKGRFITAVSQNRLGAHCAGVDISPALLQHVPDHIEKREGYLEMIPFSDNTFDVVFSVEAIEHSANLAAAVDEMIRVTRPGGLVMIIDKHSGQWGRLSCPPWETWPDIKNLSDMLSYRCTDVSTSPIGYDARPPEDGLMVMWRGRKV